MIVAVLALGLAGAVDAKAESIDERIQRKVEAAVAEAMKPLATSLVPSGTVIAYLGEATASPEGWQICGRGGKFPSFEGRFLLGTHHIDSVGKEAGSPTHDHGVSIRSTGEKDGRRDRHIEGADNHTGSPNWFHRHHVTGRTASTSHIPPAIQVLFLCKQ